MIAASILFLAAIGLDVKVVFAALLLAGVSFLDDLRGLPAWTRFLVQCLAVALSLYTLDGRLFPDSVPAFCRNAVHRPVLGLVHQPHQLHGRH